MHVHVDVLRRHLQADVGKVVAVLRQVVGVDAVQGLFHGGALDQAVVDEEQELGLFDAVVGIGDPTVDLELQVIVLGRELEKLVLQSRTEEGTDVVQLAAVARRAHVSDRLALLAQGKGHSAVVNGIAGDHLGNLRILLVWILQRLASRDRVVKQVFHNDLRALVACAGLGFSRATFLQRHELAVRVLGLEGALRGSGARDDGDVGDVADGGQGLAAEAKGADAVQVVKSGQLARREALADNAHVLFVDAGAVVLDLQQLHAALLCRDDDAGGLGVQTVLQHLLDGIAGPLDDLARRNAVDDRLVQTLDALVLGRALAALRHGCVMLWLRCCGCDVVAKLWIDPGL
eukprot:m.210083 g.210083  ORF g.210083 m.210083 type:complete len:346 (-) comp17815_c0_seq1:114-1151(-)